MMYDMWFRRRRARERSAGLGSLNVWSLPVSCERISPAGEGPDGHGFLTRWLALRDCARVG